ncbi:hypothetical protein [Teredinibacter turnerae]|uniref:hypothetical protein n=1 Tax=Teredinibacter turnerae TaxID=2426 RepID=UPI000423380A|nr:hypothetical protein [Teredinibacter turnerae]
MKIIGLIGLCIFLVACAGSTSTKPQSREVSKPLTDSEKAYLSQVEADGRLLYEKDARAATATDLLLSKINPADYPNFVGWVTYPNSEDFTVSFYEKSGKDFKVIADINFWLKGSPSIDLNPSRIITATERSMIQARIVALQSGANSCSDRFNTVIIPSQNKEAWDVYVLAATTDPKLVQVGGHVKVTVSKTTAEVMEKLPLSKSCLALDKSGDNLPEGASISALTVSHIVTPMPVAIHPYLNLLHNISLAISSERGLWMIESGSIRMLR